jgi:cell wall-associated NlpC family hydrolase
VSAQADKRDAKRALARWLAAPALVLLLAGVAATLTLPAARGPRAPAQPARAVVQRLRAAHARAARAGAHRRQRSAAAAASPHVLGAAELASLASGASSYRPAPSLISAYRAAAARYRIVWRLLAAVGYISGGYGHASARTAAPSPALARMASRLAAAGAAQHPGAAVASVLGESGASAQTVLTLAQATDTRLPATASPRARVRAMLAEAHLLDGLPYVWGGGHTEPAWVIGSGYDCSGFVSAVLHAGGYLSSPETTQTLPGAPGILSGPGRYVTIYDRTIATLRVRVTRRETRSVRRVVAPDTFGVHVTRGRGTLGANAIPIRVPRWVGAFKTVRVTRLVASEDTTNNDEHVIIDIAGQWWESGGSTADGGGAMVHRILDPNHAYLKSFNRILHPRGL